MKTKALSPDRYNLIDVIRAAAVISMIAYHLCYDIFVVYGVFPSFWKEPPVVLWERTICFTFIILSGVSQNFSRHAVKRGVIVNLCGFAVTIATVLIMPSEQIWFGVLNLIGCAMLLTHALRGLLNRANPAAGMIISMGLFALTYGIPKRFLGLFSLQLIPLPKILYRYTFLAFLGFPSAKFHSSDFFPLIPWLFLYVFGYFLWRYLKAQKRDGLFRLDIPVLSFIGRHSLVIYLVHQPLLYLLCAAAFGHF